MAPVPHSDELERLLHGDDASSAPNADAGRVARLLATMQGAPTERELAGATSAIATIVAAIERTPMPTAHRRSRMLPQFLSAKAAAIGLAAVLAGATAAAASTGSLPAPAQSAVSTGLSHVGVSIPGPDAHPHVVDDRSDTTTTTSTEPADQADHPRGPDATGPARVGLCRAWTAHTANGHAPSGSSIAFRNLRQAASDAGQSVADYCKDARAATPDGNDDAEPPHTPTSPTPAGAPVTTPNPGGTGTAHDASDGHSDHGTSHGPDAATLGSGNGSTHASDRH